MRYAVDVGVTEVADYKDFDGKFSLHASLNYFADDIQSQIWNSSWNIRSFDLRKHFFFQEEDNNVLFPVTL